MNGYYIKLSDYAKKFGITYRCAWNRYKKGMFPDAFIDETGHICLPMKHFVSEVEPLVAVYARVSSSENKSNLDTQADRLVSYCNAKGYKVDKVVKEVGSGLNDTRPKLESLLMNKEIRVIVVEHKDRLARFGLNYIQKLLENDGRRIEIVNNIDGEKEDLMQDFVSIITSFCARLYGYRRTKRKTEQLISALENEDK